MKIAFLNGKLNVEVHMIQPEGFISTDESKVCKLQRSIYRLKQTTQSWNIRFDKIIRMYGFVRNREEPCIYKWANGSIIVFLLLYIDDIFLIENDVPTLQRIKCGCCHNSS